MQLHDSAIYVLPVPEPGPAARRGGMSGGGSDELRPGVLYRGEHFAAGSSGAVRAVRLLVTTVLADWRYLPLVDDVVLCASELAANAVRHADWSAVGPGVERVFSVGLRCWKRSELFLEVSDFDWRMPKLFERPDGCAESGRGLLLVAELADALFWKRAAHGGKIVYARWDVRRFRRLGGAVSR